MGCLNSIDWRSGMVRCLFLAGSSAAISDDMLNSVVVVQVPLLLSLVTYAAVATTPTVTAEVLKFL